MSGTPVAPERLLPVLQESIQKMGSFTYIHNPFLVSLVSDEVDKPSEIWTALNHTFLAVQEHYGQAIDRQDYASAVMLHVTRPYRALAFDELSDEMSPSKYWALLGEVWIDQENPSSFTEEWRTRLSDDRPHKRLMMNPEERAALRRMDEVLTVYRAGYADQVPSHGLSWTLERKVAEWFAARHGQKRPLYTAQIAKRDVTAYFSRRGESEILVADPEALKDLIEITSSTASAKDGGTAR